MSAEEEKPQDVAADAEPSHPEPTPGPPAEAPVVAQVVEPVVAAVAQQPPPEDMEDDDEEETKKKPGPGRRKINIEFIEDKSRRHITFSKRKAGIMKKAYELSALTGTQVLLLVASETGHVYTYATEKLQPLIQKPEGKNLIQTCLSAPDQQAVESQQAARPQAHPAADSTAQYAAMAAAVAAAQQAATQERPQKQRKTNQGGQSPGMYGGQQLPPGMAGMAGLNPYGLGMPYGSMGAPAGQDMGRGGLPFGMDARSLPGMPGQIPGMPAGMGAAQLQGLSPALLQGLMSGQLPSPAMMGMEGGFGGAGGKLEALQQTIADATNAARERQ